MNDSSKSHITVIDSLRGLAAIAVCLYHFVCTTDGYISDKLLYHIFSYGHKGIQVFFIISGVVVPFSMIRGRYTYRALGRFLAKRVVRLEPPYIAAVVLSILAMQLPGSTWTKATLNAQNVALHIGYLVPFFKNTQWINPVFWTLAIEFQYYLFLAFALPLATSRLLLSRLVFYVLMLAPAFVFGDVSFLPHWAPLFLLGVGYILFSLCKIENKEYLIVSFITAIVVSLQLGYLDLLIAVATLFLVHFFKAFDKKIGTFAGDISYSLYLLHLAIGVTLINFAAGFFHESYQKFFVVLFAIALSIFCAWLFNRLIEKPFQKISKRIKYIPGPQR